MQEMSGHCGKCGAPYYMPWIWHGIIPPTPQPTCNCWNNDVVITNGTTGDITIGKTNIDND